MSIWGRGDLHCAVLRGYPETVLYSYHGRHRVLQKTWENLWNCRDCQASEDSLDRYRVEITKELHGFAKSCYHRQDLVLLLVLLLMAVSGRWHMAPSTLMRDRASLQIIPLSTDTAFLQAMLYPLQGPPAVSVGDFSSLFAPWFTIWEVTEAVELLF